MKIKFISAHMVVSVEGLSDRARDLHKRVKDFIESNVAPVEAAYVAHSQSDNCWKVFQPMEELKVITITVQSIV